MSDGVTTKRKYNAGRRATQAADTKDAILDAARILFVNSGWQATTIAGIAKAAAVSTETIYARFRNKKAILQMVVERAIRGAESSKALLDQAGSTSIARAETHDQQIELFARDICRVLFNVADVMAVVRTAAETDPELAKLYFGFHDGRRRNLSLVAAALLDRGPLGESMDNAQATAQIWRLASPELFLLMTRVEGLSLEDYTEWLSTALKRVLLIR